MSTAARLERPLETTRLTEILSKFVAETPASRVPPAALQSARYLILDTIGVSLAASTRRVGKLISEHVAEENGKQATASVFGRGALRVSPPLAAMANGTMANALDYDGGGHLPTHILPAALAVAEHEKRSGKDALIAFIVAYEAAHKLTKVIEGRRSEHKSPTHRGWWHVGLMAPIGAAMAAARLLGFDSHKTATAIGIATVGSAGFRRNMGTMAKALHSGNGARFGIEATSLARRGFTADPAILESPLGFVFAVSPADERDTTAVTERLAKPYALEKSPGVKEYPAVTPGHAVIDAARAVKKQNAFAPEDVESVEADYVSFSLLREEAHDDEEAAFCAPFLIAAALVHGKVGLEEVSEEGVRDPKVRALMKRVKQVPQVAKGKKTVTVHLRDGRKLTAQGSGSRITDTAVIEAKFAHCAGAVLGDKPADELKRLILSLDSQPDIQRLMAVAGGRS